MDNAKLMKYFVVCYSQNVNFPLSGVIELFTDVTIKFLFIAENYMCRLKKQ